MLDSNIREIHAYFLKIEPKNIVLNVLVKVV